MIREIIDDVLLGMGTVIYAYWLYQMAIAAHGFRLPPSLPVAQPLTRFLVLVPARDEDAVIGHLLDSLLGQHYPRERFDVYVSCDHCTDETSGIAREKSVVAIERSDGEPGKTANLSWALDRLPLDRYDAVAIFDADNLVDPGFLARMNDHLVAHPDAKAVQGYLDVKNPDDSWVTRVYALSFWYANRFWQQARANIGLSVSLGGTGEVLRVELLRRLGWQWETLTDDLELTSRIILAGGRVRYEYRAVSYDEKPTTQKASRAQRARWLNGHYAVLGHFGPAVLRDAISKRSLVRLDHLLYLLIPGRAAMFYFTMFGGFVIAAFHVLLSSGSRALPDTTAWLFAACSLIQCTFIAIVAPSFRRRRLTLRHTRDIAAFAWYGLTFGPVVVRSLLVRPAGWSRTTHNSAISIEEVQGHRAGNRRARTKSG